MLPLPVMVALRLSPLALMVALEPRLAWVLAVTTLMATPTPTWVLETLPLAGAAAAAVGHGVPAVSLLALRLSRPPALTLMAAGSEALTVLVAMLMPRAAATPTEPSEVLA